MGKGGPDRREELEETEVGLCMDLGQGHQTISDKLERPKTITKGKGDSVGVEGDILRRAHTGSVGLSDGSPGNFL